MSVETASDALQNLVFLTGSANPKLADNVGEILGVEVHHVSKRFGDGAPDIRIPITVRRRDVVIIQSACPPDINGYFEELKDIIDAARRVSAKEITAVIPYFPYARSDKMNRERCPISGARAAREIVDAGSGIRVNIMTIDLHSEALQGSIVGAWDNLYASYCLVPAVKKRGLENIVIASPDRGGSERAFKYRDFFGPDDDVAIFYKIRDSITREPTVDRVTGDVENKNLIFVDDIIDSGKTIVGAANYAKTLGAKSVRAVVTHGLFTGNALEKINNSPIEEIYITDTVPARMEMLNNPKIRIEPIASLLAEGIKRVYTGESIQNLFLSTKNLN